MAKRQKVQGGYIQNGTFYKRVGTSGGDIQSPIYKAQPGKYERKFERNTGGDSQIDIYSAQRIPEPKKKAAPKKAVSTKPSAEAEAARARAEAERQRAQAERARIDEERVSRNQARERPVTRGGSAPTRRPTSDGDSGGRSLLGAALVRDEDRGRQLVSPRRGKGRVTGIS